MGPGIKSTKSKAIRRNMLACRIRLGLTQKKVAELAGITQFYYTMIENGQRTPTNDVFKSIAGVLKTDWKGIVEVESVDNE